MEEPAEDGAETTAEPPDRVLLESPATASDLRFLFYQGLLPRPALATGLLEIGVRREWPRWTRVLLLCLGLGLAMAGVLFFVAYNWIGMDKVLKFGGLQLITLGLAFGAWRRGIHTVPGRALLIAACFMVGVFLAAFGQVYQTGADAYELLRAWALLILLWVIAGRSSLLWLIWVYLVSLTLYVYWQQVQVRWRFEEANQLWILLAGIQAMALALFEFGRSRGVAWLQHPWPRWVLVPTLFWRLAMPASIWIMGKHQDEPWGAVAVLLLVLAVVGAYRVYRFQLPDLWALTCAATALAWLAFMAILKGSLELDLLDECAIFLVLGAAVVLMLGGLVKWVLAQGAAIRALRVSDAPAAQAPAAQAPVSDVEDQPATKPEPRTSGGPTVPEVLDHVRAADLITEPELDVVVDRLARKRQRDETPWFLMPIIFLGAMLAALLFTVGLVALIHLDDKGELVTAGGFYLVVAVLLHRAQATAFTHALALSLSIGGHIMILIGVHEISDDLVWTTVIAAVLCGALYELYRDGLHRFLTVLLVIVMSRIAFPKADAEWFLHLLVVAATATCCWSLTGPRSSPMWRPLGYACAAGLLVLVFPIGNRYHDDLWMREAPLPLPLVANVVIAAALLWCLRWASQQKDAGLLPRNLQIVAVGLILVLAAFTSPALLAALLLAVIGHASHHWHLAMVGLLSLPVFLWKYYYNVELDYLAKSAALLGSGALLLAARWGVRAQPEGQT